MKKSERLKLRWIQVRVFLFSAIPIELKSAYTLKEKPIPTELRSEARELMNELELDLDPSKKIQAFDDEYQYVGLREPKVCVTTSRDPSSRLKQFSKWVDNFFFNTFITDIVTEKSRFVFQTPNQLTEEVIELKRSLKLAKNLTLRTSYLLMKLVGNQTALLFVIFHLVLQHISL